MIAGLEPTLILLISTFLGALVSSFAGFAFAPVAGLLLISIFAPTVVVPVLMVCSIIVQTVTLVYLRRSLAPNRIGVMLVGGALGVALAGWVAFIEATFAKHTGYANAMALTAFTVFVVGAIVIALGPERKAHRFGET